MARLARVVVPGVPHHVTQRGNRRQTVFFGEADYRAYIAILAEHIRLAGVAVWAWCLMPNHVHLMLLPSEPDGLRAALGEAHRRYSRMINLRQDWRGYLWQGRFSSCPLDESHALTAARYIELNPVRARLAERAEHWPWSSARAHLTGRPDGLTEIAALGAMVSARPGDWRRFLGEGPDETGFERLRAGERTGRPVGGPDFLRQIEARTGRALAPGKPGPKPRATGDRGQESSV